VVDLYTGAVVAAEMLAADRGDTATLPDTLASAARHLGAVEAAPSPAAPAELAADTGYHSREALKALDNGAWNTHRRAEATASCAGHGTAAARCAVVNNRTRLLSGVARAAFRLHAEIVERCFALAFDRGGIRRTWLLGRENIQRC
jgi:transposase